MKKKVLLLLLAIALTLGITHAAYASDEGFAKSLVHFTGEQSNTITQYDNNKMPFFFGNNVNANLDMDTTAFFYGNNVTIEGNYANDVFVFGNSVAVDANIEGNLYMFSSDGRLNGSVSGDLFNFSAIFQQTASGKVNGSLYAFCATPNILGQTGKNLYLFCNDAYVSGTVGGNLQGAIDALTIDDTATIAGIVQYRSNTDPVLIGSAQSIPYERYPIESVKPKTFAQEATELLLSALGFAAALLLVYLVFTHFAPNSFERVKLNLRHRPAAVFGLGCAVLLVAPIATILLMLISPKIGLALLFLYLFLIVIAMLVSLIFLLDLILFSKKSFTPLLRLLFVALLGFAVKLLLAVSVLGVILGIAGLIFGIGLLASLTLKPIAAKGSDTLETQNKEEI